MKNLTALGIVSIFTMTSYSSWQNTGSSQRQIWSFSWTQRWNVTSSSQDAAPCSELSRWAIMRFSHPSALLFDLDMDAETEIKTYTTYIKKTRKTDKQMARGKSRSRKWSQVLSVKRNISDRRWNKWRVQHSPMTSMKQLSTSLSSEYNNTVTPRCFQLRDLVANI